MLPSNIRHYGPARLRTGSFWKSLPCGETGTVFTDHDVHRMLRINGIKNQDGEWFRCTVAQVKAAIIAVRNLLAKSRNRFYRDYKVIVAAGSSAGIGVVALPPVLETMDDPLTTKSITLSCGKLTTGVTMKP